MGQPFKHVMLPLEKGTSGISHAHRRQNRCLSIWHSIPIFCCVRDKMGIKRNSIFSLKFRAWSRDRCLIFVLPVLLPSFHESCVKRAVDAGQLFLLLMIIDKRSSTKALLAVLVYLIGKNLIMQYICIENKYQWKMFLRFKAGIKTV